MIPLNRKQLKALAESVHTRETLEGLYSWKQDRGITYSESLQLLAHEEDHPLQQPLLKVPPGCCGGSNNLAPKVVGVMSTQNLTDKEAEAVVATDMATELLQEFFGYIQKDLRHYSEKYADYKVYSEYAGVLAEDKDELLGRLTAWNHHITQGVGSTFLIISVWEPGKDPKSAYRYYLVKE